VAVSEFFQRVYEIAARIPRGKVVTYGQIAVALGDPRQARTVGWAMRSTPEWLDIPWHRVVNSSGGISTRHSFGELYRRGQRKVSLDVDAQSLTGATRVYEKAGMDVQRQTAVYEKELRSGQYLSTRSVED